MATTAIPPGQGPLLSLKQIFGLSADVGANIHYLDESIFLYPAGNQVVIYNSESRTQRFIHATEATSPVSVASGESGISALAVSPKDRKYVAVAERGERASVTVFNIHTLKKSRTALVSGDCASKQYISVAFSSDQRFILTQGGAPDYCLINWLWEKSRPVQSIKLATGVNVRIRAASFHPSDPNVVVVIGSNLIRLLRCEANEFKAIPLVLKAKKDSMEFQCLAWDGDRCLIGADNGEIMVIEGLEHRRTYCTPKEANSIHSIAVYNKGFICGCEDGLVHIFERIDDKNSHTDADKPDMDREGYRPYKTFRIGESTNNVICMDVSPSGESLTCTLDNSQAYTLNLSQVDIFKADDMNFELLSHEFHTSAVTGLDVCVRKPLIATCSFDGSIRIWNYEDNSCGFSKVFDDPPLSVAFHPSGLLVVVGFSDRLSLLNVLMDGLKAFKDLPVKDCRECAFSHGGQYFAAVSGTTIAVFQTYTGDNVVNLRGHTGKIRSVVWNGDDTGLVSAGMNGIVIEWDLHTGNRLQEFEQKNCTFTSVGITSDRHLYAVGNDSVLRELFQGSLKASFDLNVVMTRLVLKTNGSGRMLFLGGSTGAIRVFKLPLSNNYQSYSVHAGLITAMKVSPDESMLFAASEDGSVSVLEIRDGRNGLALKREKKELAWAEEVDELTMHNEYQTRLKEMNYQEQIRGLNEKYNNEVKAEKQKLAMLQEEKEALESRYNQKLKDLMERERTNRQDIADMESEYQVQLETIKAAAVRIEKEKMAIIEEFEETKGIVEKDADQEIDELKDSFDAKLATERKQTLSLGGNNGVLKAKFAKMQSRIKKQKEQIEAMVEDERKLYEVIRGLEKDIEGYQKEISERGSTIADKDKRINDLRKKNQELEKFKFVLDYKIRELNRQIQPREQEIERKKRQLEEMDGEVRKYRADFASLNLNVKELKLRLAGMQQELNAQRDKNKQLQEGIRMFNHDLQELGTDLDQPKKLKKQIVTMYQRYSGEGRQVQNSKGDVGAVDKEHQRQRAYLEKMIHSLNKKHGKEVQIHKKANLRIMADNASLVAEINELRRDIGYCDAQAGARGADQQLRKAINAQEQEISQLQSQLKQRRITSKGAKSVPMDEFTPRFSKS